MDSQKIEREMYSVENHNIHDLWNPEALSIRAQWISDSREEIKEHTMSVLRNQLREALDREQETLNNRSEKWLEENAC